MTVGDPDPVRIHAGTRRDLERLARYHYRAGPPATVSRVLVATEPERPSVPIGVLVVSRPVLNGPWRADAWPELWRTPDRRSQALCLNRTVRTISRVIVHPRWRSRGVAVQLVRSYLARPITARTEALSAMGAWSGFFVRAGMRRVPMPVARRDARLRASLAHLGIEPWRLADPFSLAPSDSLERALRSWASGAGATRPMRDATFATLARLASRSVDAKRHAFIAEHPDPEKRHAAIPHNDAGPASLAG